MFGVILGLISAGGAAIGKTIQSVNSYNFRKKADVKGNRVYWDHFGATKDVKTNKDLFFGFYHGDRCYFDDNGNIIYNLTKEERDKDFIERLNNSDPEKTAIYYHQGFYRKKANGFEEKYKYNIYIDKVTKQAMYKKEINFWNIPNYKKWAKKYQEIYKLPMKRNCELYFDIKTDKAIRLADEEVHLINLGIEKDIVDMVNDPEWRKNIFNWML